MVKSHFGHTDFDSLYQIFKTYCMLWFELSLFRIHVPKNTIHRIQYCNIKYMYGSQLWDYDNKISDTFNVTCRKTIRRLLNLPNTTHCNLIPHIYDDIPPNLQLYKRVISFVNGLSKSTNVITSLCYRLDVNGSGSSVSNTILILSSIWYELSTKILTLYLHALMTA